MTMPDALLVAKFRLTYRPLTNGVWRVVEVGIFAKKFVDEVGGIYNALRIAESAMQKKLLALDGFPMRCCKVERRNPILQTWIEETYPVPPPPAIHSSDPGDETPPNTSPSTETWPVP